MNASRETILLLGGAGAALALALLAVHLLGLEQALLAFLARVEAAGAIGGLVFALLVMLSVPALVPSVLLTLGAGALYGVVLGTLLIVSAETLGALIAFLLARHLFAPRAEAVLVRQTRLRRVLGSVGAHDWRFVALLRMIPFFPFKMANYLLGLTPLTTTSYALGTWVGLVPIALFNVHLGAVAGDVLALGSPEAMTTAPSRAWLNGVALLFSAAVTVTAARRATRLLASSAVEEVTADGVERSGGDGSRS